MKYSLGLLAGAGLLAGFIAVPANVHGQQSAGPTQEQHDHEHQAAGSAQGGGATAQRPGMMNPDMMKMMGDMKVRDAKIEVLVQKMNTAKGAEKTEVMADLLTALVEDRRAMHSSMMGMMMNMTGPMPGHGPAENDKPKQ